MWHDMWGWGGMWFGWIFWLVIIGLIIWGVKTIARSQSGSRPQEESAMSILKKRYARGEINDEEFEEKKRRLQGTKG
ncbi:MAG: SHOCT domain-containing protein [Planctomycetota bacterium]|jgi:putative membrane protein